MTQNQNYQHDKTPSPSVSRSNPMALPIVLLRDKNQELTHEQCLQASFSHLSELTLQSLSNEWTPAWQEPWDNWKNGKFRKIVKRANPQRFSSLAKDPDAIHTKFFIGGELIELLSFPPYSLDNQDPRVRPLQVAGLNYEASKSPASIEDWEGLILAYDGSLNATTGKMMAQSAHAAQVLVRDYPTLKSEPLLIVDGLQQDDVKWLVTIVDSGFTEVAPNSTTVKVGFKLKSK